MTQPVKKIPNPCADFDKSAKPFLYFTGTEPSFEIFTTLLDDGSYKATASDNPNVFTLDPDPDKARTLTQEKMIDLMAKGIRDFMPDPSNP